MHVRGYDSLLSYCLGGGGDTTTAAAAVDDKGKEMEDLRKNNKRTTSPRDKKNSKLQQQQQSFSSPKRPMEEEGQQQQLLLLSSSSSFWLDPMMIELCHQLGRLMLPTTTPAFANAKVDDDDDDGDEDDPTQEFVHQWRKAIVAIACDLLEGCLLPLLLSEGGNGGGSSAQQQGVANVNKVPPSLSLLSLDPSWKEWIPWMTTLVKDEQGRQLLRTQFPLISADIATSKSTTGGTERATSTTIREISCSTVGVVLQLLYASVMVEQNQAGIIDPSLLSLCQTLRDQSVRFIHSWLQCFEARQGGDISFLDLVSEYSEYYKSACAWILHQSETDPVDRKAIDPDIATMIRAQLGELSLDEEDALAEREEKYSSED